MIIKQIFRENKSEYLENANKNDSQVQEDSTLEVENPVHRKPQTLLTPFNLFTPQKKLAPQKPTEVTFESAQVQSSTGLINRENIATHIQSLLDNTYAKPLPRPEDVVISFKDQQWKWFSLTKEQKVEALLSHALPHQINLVKQRPDFALFQGSHTIPYLPNDPRVYHGSDHAVRVSIFTSVFAYLYNKYHPTASISPEEVIVAQMAGIGHDSQRQTEGTDIDDGRSGEYTAQFLEKRHVSNEMVNKAKEAIQHKDATDLPSKHLIAKCVQNADSIEYGRLINGKSDPTYLDIYREFKDLSSLKDGKTYGEFEEELTAIRQEMTQLILYTHNKMMRALLSEPGKNYYSEMLAIITPKDYPLLHKILEEQSIIT